MHENLVRRFAEAGLILVLSDRPIVIGLRGQGDEVVQVDIQRKTNGSRRQEWFRIYPGAKTNRVEVVGTDKKYGQVVLMVHEPVREFIEPLSYTAISGIDFGDPSWRQVLASRVNARAQNLTPVYRKGRVVSVSAIRKTPDRKRHMLMGLDERQLFIAELPRGVSTVMGAHRILKGGDVGTGQV